MRDVLLSLALPLSFVAVCEVAMNRKQESRIEMRGETFAFAVVSRCAESLVTPAVVQSPCHAFGAEFAPNVCLVQVTPRGIRMTEMRLSPV